MINLFNKMLVMTDIYGQNKKTDVEKAGLKGKVKSVHHIIYEAIEKFGEITKGEEVEYSSFSNDSNVSNVFDDKGNMIEDNNYNSDGSLITKWISKYDDKGNMIESNEYNSDGSFSCKYTYKYEFDSHDNWVKQIEYFDNKSDTITERTIEYY